MLRPIFTICLAILLGWSVGVHAGEPVSAVDPKTTIGPVMADGTAALPCVAQRDMASRINVLQVPFIVNDGGDSEDEVKFFAKTLAGSVLVADQGISYHMKQSSKPGSSTVAIKETWIKPKNSQAYGLKPSKARFNFFKGADQQKWRRNVLAFDEVGFGQVYDGVSVTLKAYNNNVEKIFSVESGADPGRISIRVDGVSDLRISKAGELELVGKDATLRMTAPVAYQEINGDRKYVKTTYNRLSKNTYGFKVDGYDRSQPLIIDPLLASTFLGGTDSDFGYAIDSDDNASIFVTGWTKSFDFPIIDGANPFQNVGSYDVFVSKFRFDNLELEASTFLGGSLDDFGMAIALFDDPLDNPDAGLEVYVAGSTKSSDFSFPPYRTSFDSQFNGAQDAFLCKLDYDLSELKAATFLGGSGIEKVYAMKIGLINASFPQPLPLVYVTGTTQSKNFPVLGESAFSVSYCGKEDVFVSAFDTDFRLYYSTFLGGSSTDISYALELASDSIFLAGATLSPNFPTTPGSYRRVLNGKKADIFVSRLNFSLGILEASTLLGGSTDDVAYALAVDNATIIKNVYVAGYTNSVNFPTRTNYSMGKKVKGKEDAFIARLLPTLTGKVTDKDKYAAIVVGLSLSDTAVAMKLDSANHRMVVTGTTTKSSKPELFPGVSENVSYQSQNNGGVDGFVMLIDDNLTIANPIIQATYIGGTLEDRPMGLFLHTKPDDYMGNIYIVGTTKSSNYPASGEIFGKEEAFVTRFDTLLAPTP